MRFQLIILPQAKSCQGQSNEEFVIPSCHDRKKNRVAKDMEIISLRSLFTFESRASCNWYAKIRLAICSNPLQDRRFMFPLRNYGVGTNSKTLI